MRTSIYIENILIILNRFFVRFRYGLRPYREYNTYYKISFVICDFIINKRPLPAVRYTYGNMVIQNIYSGNA